MWITDVCSGRWCSEGTISLALVFIFNSGFISCHLLFGVAHADYYPEKNIAVKHSCVRVLSSVRLTPWSLAEWESRVVLLWDEVSIGGNVERVLISTRHITSSPLLALLTEQRWGRTSRRWSNASILCLDWKEKKTNPNKYMVCPADGSTTCAFCV